MKFDVDQLVMNPNSGTPHKVADASDLDADGRPTLIDASLGRACRDALTSRLPEDEKEATVVAAQTRWELTKRLLAGGIVEMNAKEVSMITERAWKVYTTIFAGPISDMLDAPIAQSNK